MTVEVRDPRLGDVVDPAVAIERLATGFDFTEGPIWQPRERHLIFSDMPGDHMRRWRQGEGITTFRKPANMANGNAYDRAGRIVTCEHATSRVTRTARDGAVEVLASHWQGRELNSPNDVIVKSDGAIYFTDPTFGRMEYYGRPREPELDFQGVYRLEPESGTLALLADDFGQPNGLCFDLDERRLFVNDTERAHIRVFEVEVNGTLGSSRVWAAPAGEGAGAPDGMKIDAAGNLLCTGPGGIHVFAPDATCLGVIRIPEVPANFTWGDADLRSLLVCASTSLYRVRLKVPGRPAF
jgi:gluconolactonase